MVGTFIPRKLANTTVQNILPLFFLESHLLNIYNRPLSGMLRNEEVEISIFVLLVWLSLWYVVIVREVNRKGDNSEEES